MLKKIDMKINWECPLCRIKMSDEITEDGPSLVVVCDNCSNVFAIDELDTVIIGG